MATQLPEFASEKLDVYTTLAIAALIHQSDEGVRECAKELQKRTSHTVSKNILDPMVLSSSPLEVMINSYIYPLEKKVIGSAWMGYYEYELTAVFTDQLDYEYVAMRDTIVEKFIQRGVTRGRLAMQIKRPHQMGYYDTSVNMTDVTQSLMGSSHAA